MERVVILGSTGFIGRKILNIINLYRERFKIVGLTTKRNVEVLSHQVRKFSPEYVCITDENFKSLSFRPTKVLFGENSLSEIIKLTKPDIVFNAVVGIAGLKPLITAIKENIKKIALVNKESIVTGGEIVNQELKKNKSQIIPVDSEHSAIYQCLKNEDINKVSKIVLTSSGGPLFRKKCKTVEAIITHPVWPMGKKISVDSATMVNKGFECIETHFLFNVPYEKINIVIHPQAMIHSFVEFIDGAILCMISIPDMTIPISYALGFPERLENKLKKMDILDLNKIEFYKPDYRKFPLLKLVLECAKSSHSYVIVFNAANEVVIENFIERKIKFNDIEKIIKKVVSAHKPQKVSSTEDILELDRKTRKETNKILANIS